MSDEGMKEERFALFKRECPLLPSEIENMWHMMKNRIVSNFVHS